MKSQIKEFLIRFMALFGCSFIGAMLGYGVKLLLFKPLVSNRQVDGLGILLISLTMQLPIILGGLIGMLIGLLAAASLRDGLFTKSPQSRSKQRPVPDNTRESETCQAMQNRHPYAPAGIEMYKTKLMKAYRDSRKDSIRH